MIKKATKGETQLRIIVIGKLDIKTTSKFKIFGYMSRGDKVPEVMMTESNLENIGLMAMVASRQDRCRTGFGMFGA